MRCYFFQYYKCAFLLLPIKHMTLFHTLPLRYPSTLWRWILFCKDARKETNIKFIYFLILENRIFQKDRKSGYFVEERCSNFHSFSFQGSNLVYYTNSLQNFCSQIQIHFWKHVSSLSISNWRLKIFIINLIIEDTFFDIYAIKILTLNI